MGSRIVGDHPEGGVRFDLERKTGEAPWLYEGSVFTTDRDHRVRLRLDDGVVTVEDDGGLPKEALSKVRLLLRTAWKHAETGVPPRRLHRWRPA